MFYKSDFNQAIIIKRFLYLFELWSKLHINFNRTAFAAILHLGQLNFIVIVVFYCKIVNFPITYMDIT